MSDAMRDHAREPRAEESIAALAEDIARCRAMFGRLLASPVLTCGAADSAAAGEIYALQRQVGDLGRRIADSTAAQRELAASWQFTALAVQRAAAAAGVRHGGRGRARHARGRSALRIVPVAALLGSGWTLTREIAAGHKDAAAAAVLRHGRRLVMVSTAAAVTAGTVTLAVQTVPYTSAPPRPPRPAAAAPPSAVPVPAAGVTTLPPHRHRRKAHQGTAPALPSPAPSPRRTSPEAHPPSQAPPGTLSAPGLVITSGGTGTLTLTAEGGPVTWTLTCSAGITLSAYSGTLAEGATVYITVTAAGPDGSGTIWLPGGLPVRVRPPRPG